MAAHRIAATRRRALVVPTAPSGVASRDQSPRDETLETEENAVQIRRHDGRGHDRGEVVSLGEPARTEVPATFARGADIPIDVARLLGADADCAASTSVCHDFIAGHRHVIPIAIEQAAIRHSDDPPVCTSGRQGALRHPSRTDVLRSAPARILRQLGSPSSSASKLDDLEQKGRLRPAEIVCAVGVWDEAILVRSASEKFSALARTRSRTMAQDQCSVKYVSQ